jgi:hypothetical protein
MGKAIPSQHPAVVLRSHFNLVRALLGVAMIAVVGLAFAVVIVANDGDEVAGSATVRPDAAPLPQQGLSGAVDKLRYDGGPDEGTSGAVAAAAPTPGIRYDGGPEEGTSGALGSSSGSSTTPGIRYDGGPEEGTRGPTP